MKVGLMSQIIAQGQNKMAVLAWLTPFLIVRCFCVKEKYFEVRLDRNLGYLHCQLKCSERRGCTGVNYCPESLTCTLKFNLTEIINLQDHPSFLGHFNTEYVVLTRSRKKIYVVEVFYDTRKSTTSSFGEKTSSSTSNVNQLTFKPVPGAPKCKQSGRKGNIIEPNPYDYCQLRSLQAFKKNQTYSWTLSLVSKGGDRSNSMFFTFIKNNSDQGSFSLYRRVHYYYYRSGESFLKKMTNSSRARLRLVLQNNVLKVTNLNEHIDVKPVKLQKNLNNFYAEVELSKGFQCKVIINEE